MSQASVLAMFCLMTASKVLGGVETIPQEVSVEKVSNVRRWGNGQLGMVSEGRSMNPVVLYCDSCTSLVREKLKLS